MSDKFITDRKEESSFESTVDFFAVSLHRRLQR
jgi:hypothetical protein